jgi:hypothetical protein
MSGILSRECIGECRRSTERVGYPHTRKEMIDRLLNSHEALRELLQRAIDAMAGSESPALWNCAAEIEVVLDDR